MTIMRVRMTLSGGNRKVWGAELGYGGVFKCDTVWLRAPIDECDTHHCVNVIGQRCRGLILENIPNDVGYMRYGKVIAQ